MSGVVTGDVSNSLFESLEFIPLSIVNGLNDFLETPVMPGLPDYPAR